MSDTDVTAWIDAAPSWSAEMAALHAVLSDAGLDAAVKWRKPCYLKGDDNIAILQPMKAFLSLMFFKGALLEDPDGVLEQQGPNSRSAMRVCVRSVADVDRLSVAIKALVRSALAVEAAGLKVEPRGELELPEELSEILAVDAELSEAFDALTPGRQRGYAIHVSGAKQAATRISRIEKCREKILAGKGFQER